jgi:uncharacterized protein (TIGR02646 family)
MRTIRKNNPPKELIKYGKEKFSTYQSYKYTKELRQSLVDEQRGICCYCMSRIEPELKSGETEMKIEHWQCQKNFPEKQLDYDNLLGACKGNEGAPPKEQHCDTRKGDKPLSKNPANPAHCVESFIFYKFSDGTIFSNDKKFNKELNDILNLNISYLRNNRKSVLLNYLRGLDKKRGQRGWDKAFLEKELAQWNGENDNDNLAPYCQVIVYWLKKCLARA